MDFDTASGVTIRNCVVSTKKITCANPGNFAWIGAVGAGGNVEKGYWPVDNTLSAQYSGVVKLVLDPKTGTVEADPNFNQWSCGKAVSDYSAVSLMAQLNSYTMPGVTWSIGFSYPTLSWDKRNIPADYSGVEKALKKVRTLDSGLYRNFDAVSAAMNAIVRSKSLVEQAEVDGYAAAIEKAVSELEYKDADYTKVDAAVAKAGALKQENFKDFSAVAAAVDSVVRGKKISEQDAVDAYAYAIETAIANLVYKDADYSKVDEAIAKAKALNPEYFLDFSAVTAAIDAVVRGKNYSEQETVDLYASAIEEAISGLEKKAPVVLLEPEEPTNHAEPENPPQPEPTTVQPGKTENPATSDRENLLQGILFFFLFAGATATACVLKKRNLEK